MAGFQQAARRFEKSPLPKSSKPQRRFALSINLARGGIGILCRFSAAKLIDRQSDVVAWRILAAVTFRTALALAESCHREARLNVIGKMALRSDVVRILCNRLLLERDRQIYPEIAQQKIREPYSSSLATERDDVVNILLAADPAHRAPLRGK